MEDRRVVNFDPADPLEISFTTPVGTEPSGASHPHLQKYYTADTQHNGTIINGISRIGWMTGMNAARFRDEDHADIFDAKSGAFIRQSVQAGGLPVIDGSFTIALWARSATAATFSGAGAFASRRPAFALLPLAGSRQIKFLVTTASATQRELTFDLAGIDGFDLTGWHHYAASHDAATGTLRLFVDGVERGAATHPPEAPQAASGDLFLGSDDGSASFAGDLSDIRLCPLDPNDVFRIVSWEITQSGGSRDLHVTIAGRGGRSYALVGSETLAGPWNTLDFLGPLAADQPVELKWQDIPENRAFVRVRVDYVPAFPLPE